MKYIIPTMVNTVHATPHHLAQCMTQITLLAKLVREEVRRQTQYLTQTNRPWSSGVPSNCNRHTTDGLPICNKCNKVDHIACNCRAGGIQHQLPQVSQYNFHIHPSMQHQISSQFNSYTRPGMQHQSVQRPQFNSNNHPDGPTFNPQQWRTANNPFNPETNGCFFIPGR